MDILAFIASVIGSLAWPATVLCVVLLLRKELIALLPFLRKLKAGPLEAVFEREVKELKSETARTLPSPETKAVDNDNLRRLYELAKVSPRASIVEAWQGVEFAARRALAEHAGA